MLKLSVTPGLSCCKDDCLFADKGLPGEDEGQRREIDVREAFGSQRKLSLMQKHVNIKTEGLV